MSKFSMLRKIAYFYLPIPPRDVSEESKRALSMDLKATRSIGKLGEFHRRSVNVWVRHADKLIREANREWLKVNARAFAVRWAWSSVAAWLGAWAVSGRLVFEVPLTLAGFAAGVLAVVLFLVHRTLNARQR